ncbi:MAG: hypothetical protein LV479_00645 [Methylacidiphilales bacterium]|nr:hypothetical protein [Candidatus Methylacidiphilales bacterium]
MPKKDSTYRSVKTSQSVKEAMPASAETGIHYASAEMTRKAIHHVMKVHGIALQKLAK